MRTNTYEKTTWGRLAVYWPSGKHRGERISVTLWRDPTYVRWAAYHHPRRSVRMAAVYVLHTGGGAWIH